jgi:hypothetical protein
MRHDASPVKAVAQRQPPAFLIGLCQPSTGAAAGTFVLMGSATDRDDRVLACGPVVLVEQISTRVDDAGDKLVKPVAQIFAVLDGKVADLRARGGIRKRFRGWR